MTEKKLREGERERGEERSLRREGDNKGKREE
jgi:hypothetical protein